MVSKWKSVVELSKICRHPSISYRRVKEEKKHTISGWKGGHCLEKYIRELIEKGEENALNYRFVEMGIKKRILLPRMRKRGTEYNFSKRKETYISFNKEEEFRSKGWKKGSGPFAELSTGADWLVCALSANQLNSRWSSWWTWGWSPSWWILGWWL